MAKARAIVKRRKSVQNIRKITRTMELIATARYRKALDRAAEAESYTRKIAEIVTDLGGTADSVTHPLLEARTPVLKSRMLVITSNRGLAGGYNGNVLRAAARRLHEIRSEGVETLLDISGKRGIAFMRFRGLKAESVFTHFDDRPKYDEVETLAETYAKLYIEGEIDRFEIAFTQYISTSRQEAKVITLLPLTAAQLAEVVPAFRKKSQAESETAARRRGAKRSYEFLPDARGILDEIVPIAYKAQLFKCFLDSAVSEQIARMVAMKGATENADEMIRGLSMQYNRARQSQITRELAEIIGGAAALE
jgi:F-type H+-transporting ATPase subunit gamma